jgi:ligand-binding SRPBCC domain-containing protein
MKSFVFHSRLWLPRPLGDVFEFFANAENLEQITPPWLRFRVRSPTPILMREGTEIDYCLRIRGIPTHWKSKIRVWRPPYCFVDEQVRGPYIFWMHEHKFEQDGNATICDDEVNYIPLGGALLNKLFVAGDIRTIFEFRSRRLREIFGGKEHLGGLQDTVKSASAG